MAENLRVVALVATYNEADILEPVLRHLIAQGIDAYIIDNCSTDDTPSIARTYLGRGVIGVESFPSSTDRERTESFYWEQILRRKEALARDIDADWFIHHDADEARESPWAHLRLKEAIQLVDRLGFNAIDWEVLNFWPTDGAPTGGNPLHDFEYFDRAPLFDRVQVKCWKKTTTVVDLASTGGHEARFKGRKVFPIRFILKHYPIRSQAHGERKVFAERRGRFSQTERGRGWHVQYDAFDPGHQFVRDAATLMRYDPDVIRVELAVRHRGLEQVEQRLGAELEELRRDAESLRQQLTVTQSDLEEVNSTLDHVRRLLDGVFASRSWRWTAPLRRLSSRLLSVRPPK